MADYDEGMDLMAHAQQKLSVFLISSWQFGHGKERANEYNCSHAENMGLVLRQMHMLEECYITNRTWKDFLTDVYQALVEGIKEYTQEDHPWRVEAVKSADAIKKILDSPLLALTSAKG